MCQAAEGESRAFERLEERAKEEGFFAFHHGHSKLCNPHIGKRNDSERAWLSGWECADAGILPMVVENLIPDVFEQIQTRRQYHENRKLEHPALVARSKVFF